MLGCGIWCFIYSAWQYDILVITEFGGVIWCFDLQAAALANSQKRHESLLMFIGIGKNDPEDKIVEMAQRAFFFFDDDSSGQLNMYELDNAFKKMGINLTERELIDQVEEVDQVPTHLSVASLRCGMPCSC